MFCFIYVKVIFCDFTHTIVDWVKLLFCGDNYEITLYAHDTNDQWATGFNKLFYGGAGFFATLGLFGTLGGGIGSAFGIYKLKTKYASAQTFEKLKQAEIDHYGSFKEAVEQVQE